LRTGFVTAAAGSGGCGDGVWKIQQLSRHESLQVLSGYIRDESLYYAQAGEPFL